MWDSFSIFFSTGLPSNVLYLSLGLTLVIIVFGLLSKRVKDKIRFVLWTLLIEYVLIVACSTVVYRSHIDYARWELMPFWTYIAVINHTPGVKVWDIILNVVLFIPLGFFVKLLFTKFSFGKMVMIAVFCSLFIEVMQNIFSKGISQFDDIIHNTIGAMFGWLIAKWVWSTSTRKVHREYIKHL